MINMACKEKYCKEEATWTSQVVIDSLAMEVNLCDAHFQKFMDKWENYNKE